MADYTRIGTLNNERWQAFDNDGTVGGRLLIGERLWANTRLQLEQRFGDGSQSLQLTITEIFGLLGKTGAVRPREEITVIDTGVLLDLRIPVPPVEEGLAGVEEVVLQRRFGEAGFGESGFGWSVL